MSSLTRTVSGSLYRSDGSLSGWFGAAEWTSYTAPGVVAWPIPRVLFPYSGTSWDATGIRELQIFQESPSLWYALYSGGDGVNGWENQIAISTDRGVTWTRHYFASMNKDKTDGSGPWPSVAHAWFDKWGSTYYWTRVPGAGDPAAYGPNYVGLTAGPFYGDCWTATDPLGTWTGGANMTGNHFSDLNGYDSANPGGTMKVSSTYYNLFTHGLEGLEVYTASNPDGPWTHSGSIALGPSTPGLGNRRSFENSATFYHPGLGYYVCLGNTIAATRDTADANVIAFSATPTAWNLGTRVYQGTGPIDTSQDAIGVPKQVNGPDGATILGPAGEIPAIYTANSRNATPLWLTHNDGLAAMLYPSSAALRIQQSATTTPYSIRRSLSHSNVCLDLGAWILAAHASGPTLRVEYRSDSSGSNCYRALLNNSGFSLEKVVGGAASVVAASSGSRLWDAYMGHRLQIAVSGHTHTLLFDGETHVSYTDSSTPIGSGTHIGLSASGASIEVRDVTARTGNTLTVQGLNPGSVYWLRSYGSLPVASATADSSGVATWTLAHWPHYAVEVAGEDFTVNNALSGGDTLTFDSTKRYLPLRRRRSRVRR